MPLTTDFAESLIDARRYGEIVSALIAEQGGGGGVSEARMQLIRRFAACSVLAERLEACVVRGAKIEVYEYCKLTDTLVRLAVLLNSGSGTRSPTQNIADFFKHIEISNESA